MKNGVLMQYFEWNLPNDGTLWKKLKEDAAHLHAIGISAIWIPPAYKADEQQDEGYATYDLWDLGEFNQKGTIRTKYGTKQELMEAIAELKKQQISIYLDAVLNHKVRGDYTEKFLAVEVDPNQREKDISEPHTIQSWTGYEFSGRDNNYSSFKWHYYHFTGVEYDDMKRRTGVFRIVGDNKYWATDVDEENGNYDFLLGNDIDLKHPEVIDELNKWSVWIAKELHLNGFRFDAVKHMEAGFIKQLSEYIRKNYNEEFFFVGEYWNGGLDKLRNYLDSISHEITLFDVPMHYKFHEIGLKGKAFDLTRFPEETLTYAYPQNAVTFVDNHDSQAGSSLESQVEDWFKPTAYAIILLMEKAYPCLFYGDYYGIGGKESPHTQVIDLLLTLRRTNAWGEQEDYYDHPFLGGFVRKGDNENPGLALLFSIDEEGSKIMHVGAEHIGETWQDATGNIPDTVIIDDQGNGRFPVMGGSFSVWCKR